MLLILLSEDFLRNVFALVLLSFVELNDDGPFLPLVFLVKHLLLILKLAILATIAQLLLTLVALLILILTIIFISSYDPRR